MKKRLYPAVLERGPRGALGAWFPDFPGCVAGGRWQEEAIERAEQTLARAVDGMAAQGRPLPEPTPIERITLPKGIDVVAYFIVRIEIRPIRRAGEHLCTEEPDCADRQTRHGAWHEPLQLLRLRRHDRA